MRVIKCEKIILSQDEYDIWSDFENMLEVLEQGCECSDTIDLIQKIQICLSDLWEEVEYVE